MATKQQVLERHAKGWTAGMIAADLDCLPEYVRSTLARAGLKCNSERLEHRKSKIYHRALIRVAAAENLGEAVEFARNALASAQMESAE